MSRRAIAGLVALGLFVYLFALIVNVPAARVLAWVDPPGVSVHDANGRIWAGRAGRVELAQPTAIPPLSAVTWDVIAWRLLTGALHVDVQARAATLEAEGRVGVTAGGTVVVEGLTLRGPVDGLTRQAAVPVVAGGNLLARIEHARIESGQPRAVRGRAVWSDARLEAPLQLALGDVVVEIEPVEGGQRATIEAAGGELEIAGDARLEADGRYRLDLTLTPTDELPQEVRDMLTLVARQDAAGDYVIRQEGRLR